MCGIAGWAGTSQEQPAQLMGRMLLPLRHRGPDGEGWCGGEGFAIGARRLAIVDLTTGDQPVHNESADVHAVLNGEIYNYVELREELLQRGHRLRSRGDTEVLVHLWEDDGPEMLAKLRGMFALAVVDERRRRLFLARDRVGKKPLYWTQRSGRLSFASELKALRAGLPETPALDPGALASYLACGFVPEGRCILRGVAKLPPAHWLACDLAGGTPEVRRYWRLELGGDPGPRAATAGRDLMSLLEEAVALRLRADVPLAVFLSGGLDSGVVTALAARRQPSLKALTVTFAGAPGEDQLARASASMAGVDVQEVHVDPRAGTALLPTLAEVFDEPLADSSAIPTLLVAREASRFVKVVLNGDGGDEALGGYRRFLAARLRDLPGRRLWSPLAAIAVRVLEGVGGLPRGWGRRLAAGLRSAEDPYLAWGPVKLLPSEIRALLGTPDAQGQDLFPEVSRQPGTCSVDRMRRLDIDFFLPGDLLVKMDRATMAVGLEARSPFLDHVFLEWAARLPPALLLRGFRSKALLRRAAAGVVPYAVRSAPKRGFEVPLQSWLAGPWAGEVETMIEDSSGRVHRLLGGRALQRWRGWRAAGDPQRAARAVFTLLTLEHWLRRWAP
jgi:asparagine synthase (glutamine-hydrolysing)